MSSIIMLAHWSKIGELSNLSRAFAEGKADRISQSAAVGFKSLWVGPLYLVNYFCTCHFMQQLIVISLWANHLYMHVDLMFSQFTFFFVLSLFSMQLPCLQQIFSLM